MKETTIEDLIKKIKRTRTFKEEILNRRLNKVTYKYLLHSEGSDLRLPDYYLEIETQYDKFIEKITLTKVINNEVHTEFSFKLKMMSREQIRLLIESYNIFEL